jgi:hypothetical protein
MNNKTMQKQTKKAEKQAANLAIAMAPEILQNSQDINGALTETGKVRAVFHTHFADVSNDIYGIEKLIADILTQAQAVFPRGIESTELRTIAVAASLFTQDIEDEVIRRFTAGSIRYPLQTIKNYLGAFGKGKVIKIQLTNAEDSNRNSEENKARRIAKGKNPICLKPRCKWYLIDK